MDANTAVCFRKEDYAPLWKRVLIDVVDFLVIAVASVVTAAILVMIFTGAIFWCWTGLWFGYFVLLKRSTFGTLGYRTFHVRIVGFDGKRPSLWNLTVRMSFLLFGPLNYLVDMGWLSADAHRQGLRDKVAHTFVVRREATPAGSRALVYRHYDLLGMNFLFPEINATGDRIADQPPCRQLR